MLEQITIVLYLKLIKATYVQVCWQFGNNFSAISSFLSSSQILERLAFYWKRREGLQQFTIVIYLKYFKATVVNVYWCLVGTFLQSAVVCMAYQKKRQKHLAVFFVTEGKDWSSSRWSLIWKLKAACAKVWRCLVVIIPSLATITAGFCAALWVEPSNPIIIVSRGILWK